MPRSLLDLQQDDSQVEGPSKRHFNNISDRASDCYHKIFPENVFHKIEFMFSYVTLKDVRSNFAAKLQFLILIIAKVTH